MLSKEGIIDLRVSGACCRRYPCRLERVGIDE